MTPAGVPDVLVAAPMTAIPLADVFVPESPYPAAEPETAAMAVCVDALKTNAESWTESPARSR